MKKKLEAALLAASMAIGLVACGSSSSSSSSSESNASVSTGTSEAVTLTTSTSSTADSAAMEESSDSEKTEITVWHTWGAGPGLDAINEAVEEYNATNDKNVYVNINYIANQASGNTQTMDKLMAAVASGNPPEVALLDNFQVASWAAQGAIEPLDDLMQQNGLSIDGCYDWAKTGSIYKGDTYSIPYNGDCRALFYNKDLFTAAGLDPDDPPETIEELEDYAKKLTIMDGDNYKQTGLVPWYKAGKPIYTWGWAFGGNFYDESTNTLTLDDPGVVEALQWEVDFANEMGGEKFVNYASGLGSDAEDPFVNGTLAMVIRGQFDIANMKEYNPDLNYGMVQIPSKEAGKSVSWCGGWGWTIPKGAKNQEASIDFLKFMLSKDAQTKLISTNSFSPVVEFNEEMYGNDEAMKVYMDALETAQVRPPVPVGQELWDGLNTVLDSALHGEGTPEDLLKDLNTSMNEKLQEYN